MKTLFIESVYKDEAEFFDDSGNYWPLRVQREYVFFDQLKSYDGQDKM